MVVAAIGGSSAAIRAGVALVPCQPDDARHRRREADTAIEAEVIGVLERFCSAFADRDAEAVIHLFIDDGDVVVVTSEEPLLPGAAELMGFLNRYVNGPTTYSWSGIATMSLPRGRSHGCSPRALRQSRGFLRQGDRRAVGELFSFIAAEKANYPVAVMCRAAAAVTEVRSAHWMASGVDRYVATGE